MKKTGLISPPRIPSGWPKIGLGEAIFFVGLAAVAAVLFAVYTIVQVQVGPEEVSKDPKILVLFVWK